MANLKILKEKVVVTGANGLLGQKLVEVFHQDYEVYGVGRQPRPRVRASHYHYLQGDITRRSAIQKLISQIEPQAIVNAAAYTNVDGCEDEKETCWKVNVSGVDNLASVAHRLGALLVQVSTDYVFDGTEEIYTETSKPNPLGYYGRAKLASENAVIASGAEHAIVRTMVLYGTGRDVRLNFATWLIDRLSGGQPVRIVDDQFGQPTLVDDLAAAIRKIVEKRKTGIFNVAGSEYVSRYEFARRLAEIFGFDPGLITAIKTDELKQKAPRPLRSRFSLEKMNRELDMETCGVSEGLKRLKEQLERQGAH